MISIEQLIETVSDETGISPTLQVCLTEQGWCASVVDDGDVLLCPAGKNYLKTSGWDNMEDAVIHLNLIAKSGFDLAASWRTWNQMSKKPVDTL